MRRTELKRTGGLKRGGSLKSNGQLRRTAGLARGKRSYKMKVPAEIRQAVYRRSGGRCVGCGARATQLHHVLDEQTWPELAKVEANLIGCCATCNQRHHFEPGGRFPRHLLPGATLRLVARLGPRAQSHIERFYPNDR